MANTMALDPRLLEMLACPEDKGPLLYFAGDNALYNPRNRRRYAVKDDRPEMIIEESEVVSAEEHDRLVAQAKADGVTLTF
jgi:uncharacterized protein YbaR (Trm112 family)